MIGPELGIISFFGKVFGRIEREREMGVTAVLLLWNI